VDQSWPLLTKWPTVHRQQPTFATKSVKKRSSPSRNPTSAISPEADIARQPSERLLLSEAGALPCYYALLKKITDFQKLSLTPLPNHQYIIPHPGPLRGAYHDRHETLGGDAVDEAVSGAQVVAGR
jgi:hypothetical protein